MARNGLRNGHSVMVTFMNAGLPQDPNHLIHYAGRSVQFLEQSPVNHGGQITNIVSLYKYLQTWLYA